MAKGVVTGDISRGKALKLIGAAFLGASGLSFLFAEPAEALTRKARRRCRNMGGIPLE
jgi:hypothetical protein